MKRFIQCGKDDNVTEGERPLSFRDDDVSKDEYQIALDDGVDDDSLLENPSVKRFTINSYGADYTVDSIVKRMRASAFKIPEFQRKFVWTSKHSSKFIESLLMGLPVPGIFLYKEIDTNEHLVIDGQQRLRTLQAFYDGFLGEKVFRLSGVRKPWDGKTYKELENSDVLKLDDSIVHATIFQQDKPQDVLDSIYFVFERINSGGIRLSPQEIRNCVNLGPFIKLAKKLNEVPAWRNVFGAPNNRAKDEELIVRFLAFFKEGDKYERPMNNFLTKFSEKMNKSSERSLRELEIVFIDTINLVDKCLGTKAFRLIRVINAAVFDAVMVGIATRIVGDPSIDENMLISAYNRLLINTDFKSSCERATADENSVRVRRRLAIEFFGQVGRAPLN